jgi:putative oxidoreductase
MIALRIAGWINIIIGFLHLAGMIRLWDLFRWTDIENEMTKYAEISPALPYIITVIVAIFFILFGLNALAAAGDFRKLRTTKLILLCICAIYIGRGIGGFFAISQPHDIVFSIIALIIGLLYMTGLYSRWDKLAAFK